MAVIIEARLEIITRPMAPTSVALMAAATRDLIMSAPVAWRVAAVSVALAAALGVSAAAPHWGKDAVPDAPHARDRSINRQGPVNPVSTGPVEDVSHRLRAAFSFLRTPPERLPRNVMRLLPRRRGGPNWASAQRVPKLHQLAWVVSGKDYACLLDTREAAEAVGITCTSVSQMTRSGIFTAYLTDASRPRRIVVGLAPNYVSKVRVLTHGFSPVTIPVISNTFLLRDAVPEPPEHIVPASWMLPG